MKQSYKISLCALLLAGAVSMMTARAQGSGNTPTLAVFVVGGDNTLVTPLTTALGTNLTSGGRYTLTSVSTSGKLAELQAAYTAGGGSSIDRNALAEWGRKAGISAICLVVDDVKGNDHLFSAQLIDAKDSKLSGKGSYVRTGVTTSDASRVALTLTKQLEGPERVARKDVTPQQKWFEPEMVFVQGGTFQMGCNGTTDAPCYSDGRETPQRTVTLSSFSIGKYEITQEQWKIVMADHELKEPFTWKGTNCGSVPCDNQRPAESISWDDIQIFLQKLNELTGRTTEATKYRLPTSAEWEYAARGCKGNGSGNAICDAYKYSGSNNILDVGWILGTAAGYANGTTHLVGQKKPNGLGIYDMSGNVWEWCWDCYDLNYYKNTLTDGNNVNPKNINCAAGAERVRRGGDWRDDASVWPRVASRHNFASTNRRYDMGFRVVLPAQ
jgi:formylglycine-generating enzyme required for sulfatase activity